MIYVYGISAAKQTITLDGIIATMTDTTAGAFSALNKKEALQGMQQRQVAKYPYADGWIAHSSYLIEQPNLQEVS